MMNAKRMHYLLLGLLGLVIIGLFAGAYGANSFLSKKAVTLANLKLQTQSLQQQQTSLKKAKQDIATYADLEKITQQVVPQDKDQAQAVREIVNIASSAGVQLTSISFPASNLGAGATGSTGSAAAATPTAPAAAASTKPSLSQLVPVPNITGVYQLQITIQNDTSTYATYTQLYNMLAGLEKNRRTAEVSNITIQPNPLNRNYLTFVLTLNEYIKPAS